MSISPLSTLIKTFVIILCSAYTYGKVSNLQITRRKYCYLLLLSALSAPIIYCIQLILPLYTVFFITILTVTFCYFSFKQKFPQTLCITILSIGLNYAVFMIFVLIMIPVISLFVYISTPSDQIINIMLVIIGGLQHLLLFSLFQTKRLRSGLPGIISTFNGNAGVFTSALLILFSSCFYLREDIQNPAFHLLLMAFILALGIIIWLWWQKTIHTDYINKAHTQQIDILESTLQERDAELERLSKIIHKDNKLLAALELSTRELLLDTPSDKATTLLQELNRFSKERSETLHAYETHQVVLPETGLFSVDTIIRYLYQRALKHKIDFQVNLEGDIASITEAISEQDLGTLIADLGENAIIATVASEIKNVLLSIERRTDCYVLKIYDSGDEFPKEVLENLGKKRCTTHAETGGSGIGLMTTSELVQKYHAKFDISSTEVSPPYTKCVSIILHHTHFLTIAPAK